MTGGAEAAIHTTRRFLDNLQPCHAIIKLDFANLRRDLLLDTVARNIPQLYRVTLATYRCEPTQVYGNQLIASREDSQKGYSLSSLEFCKAVHPILNDLNSDLEVGFIDDLSLSADLPTLAQDVNTIFNAETYTGLRLNSSKCEIIMEDFSQLEQFQVFKDFIRVYKDHMTLL